MINKRLRSILQGSFDREKMVKGGKAFSHKCSRMTGIKICNPNFHKEFITLYHSCLSRQHSCSGISLEDGWYPPSIASKTFSSDHNYCRVPYRQVEC